MIPFTYTLRNLLRRPTQTVQLLLGTGFVVLLVMLATATNRAMENTLNNSGDTRNVIVLGAGSEESIERSEVTSAASEIISASVSGIYHIANEPAVSPEVHFNGVVDLSNGKKAQALLRGVRHQAMWVYPRVRILEGHFPNSGEVMIGTLAHQKLGVKAQEITLGSTFRFNGELLTVSGIFSAYGTVMEAEIWMPLQDLMTTTQRDNLSCVVIRNQDSKSFSDIEVFTKTRLDLELAIIKESDYYKGLTNFYKPIRWMTWVCAILLSLGALLGGLNSLNAAFSARIREFGAMQAIGFTRIQLMASLIKETTLYSSLGLIIALVVVRFSLQGTSFPFSIGVFVLDFDSYITRVAIFTSIAVSLLGTLAPGWKCLKPSLTQTLRSS